MHGEWEDYNGGKLNAIINYNLGVKDGPSKIYNKKGQVERIDYYEKGKLVNSESTNAL